MTHLLAVVGLVALYVLLIGALISTGLGVFDVKTTGKEQLALAILFFLYRASGSLELSRDSG